MLAVPAEAQRVSLHARAGVVGSTALVKDPVAVFRSVAGAPVDRDITATAAPALQLGAVLRGGFWEDVSLDASFDWAEAEVRVEESGGSRDAGTLTVLQGTLGATWRVLPRVELGAGAGLIRYDGGPAGLLGGSETSGLAEARTAWVLPVLGDRLTAGLSVQTHRFGTQPIRAAGGTDGSVTRVGITGTFRMAEVTR